MLNRRFECWKRIAVLSLRQAVREQGLADLYGRLVEIVPDIRHQYSSFEITTEYHQVKVRSQHAFQVSLVEQALKLLRVSPGEALTIVDIGDSAGTHIQYLQGLHQNVRSLSVNLDKQAVDRIRQKGLEALHARAEEVEKYAVEPDIFLSFETLEHLSAPIQFLESLARLSKCRAFVVTVPYLAASRVSLNYIRAKSNQPVSPESVHIFELSPEDWNLLFMFSGWRVSFESVYTQYPKSGLLSLTKKYWRDWDFEGFYGAVLVPDNTWRALYSGDA